MPLSPITKLTHGNDELNSRITKISLLAMIWFFSVCFPNRLEALDEIEIYLAGYGMVAQPSNQGIGFMGGGVSGEKVNGDPGLGLKVGLFPSFFRSYLGMELEAFGQNNSLKFSVQKNGLSLTKGESGLVTYGSMVNLLLRYPGRNVRPYVGIGGGFSNGILHHTDIPGRKDKSVEIGSTLGYQFLGGIHLIVSQKWFVFGEYKYGAANYHWNQLSLNFRSEYFSGGIGYIF